MVVSKPHAGMASLIQRNSGNINPDTGPAALLPSEWQCCRSAADLRKERAMTDIVTHNDRIATIGMDRQA